MVAAKELVVDRQLSTVNWELASSRRRERLGLVVGGGERRESGGGAVLDGVAVVV